MPYVNYKEIYLYVCIVGVELPFFKYICKYCVTIHMCKHTCYTIVFNFQGSTLRSYNNIAC
jgi:hypothetical protein